MNPNMVNYNMNSGMENIFLNFYQNNACTNLYLFPSWMVNCTWPQDSLSHPTQTTKGTTLTLMNAYPQRVHTSTDFTPTLRLSS